MNEFITEVATGLWDAKLFIIIPVILLVPIVWVARLLLEARAEEIDWECERTRQRTLARFAHLQEKKKRALQKIQDDQDAEYLGKAKRLSEKERERQRSEDRQLDAVMRQAMGKGNG